MKIKVCGMREPDNIRRVGELPIDYMGFIFYPKSPRYAGNLAPEIPQLPANIRKTGVFVSESVENISAVVDEWGLNVVQLHGHESPEDCRRLKAAHPALEIIKAFSVAEAADFAPTVAYESLCDYFLFDTKTPHYGGSGRAFDWKLLEAYRGQTPFFLSGGISAGDAEAIRNIRHPLFYGLDLNSRFERTAGEKDVEKLQQFLKEMAGQARHDKEYE
jgi:phosphoribosylanthranilate isomerase